MVVSCELGTKSIKVLISSSAVKLSVSLEFLYPQTFTHKYTALFNFKTFAFSAQFTISSGVTLHPY